MNDSVKQCLCLCLAQHFDFPALSLQMLDSRRAKLFKDALLVEHKGGVSVIFSYGAVVHWGVDLDIRRSLHQELLKFADQPLGDLQEDLFTFALGGDQNSIQHDHFTLASDDDKTRLAISHAMAQSIKLAVFEQQAQETINTTRHLPVSLASTGKIRLSKGALSKIRGQLFLTKSDINLNYDLLDTPDFFWQNPEFQTLYSMAANYLELTQRTEVLTKKLETINGLLEMLADEQKHQHSSALEWIIIWLIAVEIVISLLEKVF